MAESDSVEYFLFLVDQFSPSLKKLRQINEELESFAASKSHHYIWHRDEFKIQTVVPCDNGKQLIAYSDCIFIVTMLCLTIRFTLQMISYRIYMESSATMEMLPTNGSLSIY